MLKFISINLLSSAGLYRKPPWPTTQRTRSTPPTTCHSGSLCNLRRPAASLAEPRGWDLRWVACAVLSPSSLIVNSARMSVQTDLQSVQSVFWLWSELLPISLEMTFLFCIHLSMNACLQQRSFFKNESSDICKNRHNLRRRMGVCSTKPEPGKKNKHKNIHLTCRMGLKFSDLPFIFHIFQWEWPSLR